MAYATQGSRPTSSTPSQSQILRSWWQRLSYLERRIAPRGRIVSNAISTSDTTAAMSRGNLTKVCPPSCWVALPQLAARSGSRSIQIESQRWQSHGNGEKLPRQKRSGGNSAYPVNLGAKSRKPAEAGVGQWSVVDATCRGPETGHNV